MSTITPWEQQQRDADVHDTLQRQYKLDLEALRRECPTSKILDDHHLHAVLRLGDGANRYNLVARCFLVRGLLTSGRDRVWIADVFKTTPEEVDTWARGPERWTPPAAFVATLGPRARELYGVPAPASAAAPGSTIA